MEGGIAAEDRASVDVSREDEVRGENGAAAGASGENKFQTAIGAWRSMAGRLAARGSAC